MKELELSSVAIEEMTDSQLQEIEGGVWQYLAAAGATFVWAYEEGKSLGKAAYHYFN